MITHQGASILAQGMDPTLSMAMVRLMQENVDNANLSDEDFRLFVRNSLRVLKPRAKQVEFQTQPA